MSKSRHVLEALKILGLEEMLKLSQVLQVKQVPLKQAAGGEFIVWDEGPAPAAPPQSEKETTAKILEFPKKSIKDLVPEVPDFEGSDSSEKSSLLNSEIVLWQREISKNSTEVVQKKDAFNGYQKSTQMYVVKSQDLEGKQKIRFASTNGILIDKKQA